MFEYLQLSPRPAERVWNECFTNTEFYHGTTNLVFTSIQSSGLQPDYKPYPTQYLEQLVEIAERLGIDISYLLNDSQRSYVSLSLPDACEYAMKGPEVIVEARRYSTYLLKHPQICEKDRKKAADLKHWAIDFLNKHRPMMVVINPQSPSLTQYLKHGYPDYFYPLYSKDDFIKTILTETTGESEETRARSLIERISEGFNDLPISVPVLPEDLELVVGDDFYRLGHSDLESRLYAKKEFLFDIENQPPGLLSTLGIFVETGNIRLAVLKGICEDYELGEDTLQKLCARIQHYQIRKSCFFSGQRAFLG